MLGHSAALTMRAPVGGEVTVANLRVQLGEVSGETGLGQVSVQRGDGIGVSANGALGEGLPATVGAARRCIR
jgi:hypothetical protein